MENSAKERAELEDVGGVPAQSADPDYAITAEADRNLNSKDNSANSLFLANSGAVFTGADYSAAYSDGASPAIRRRYSKASRPYRKRYAAYSGRAEVAVVPDNDRADGDIVNSAGLARADDSANSKKEEAASEERKTLFPEKHYIGILAYPRCFAFREGGNIVF